MAKKMTGSRAGRTATKPKARKKSTLVRLKANPPLVGKGASKPPKTDAQKNSKKKLNKSAQKVRQTPEPLVRTMLRPVRFEKPGVSFPTIIRNTPPVPQIANSEFVHLKQRRDGRIRLPVTFGPQAGKYDRYHKGVSSQTRTIDDDGIREWKQIIYARDHNYDGRLHTCPQVVVHCQCQDYYLGGWEYALWFHGASAIINGNGNPAVKKNPTNKPGACKHIYIVYRHLKANNI